MVDLVDSVSVEGSGLRICGRSSRGFGSNDLEVKESSSNYAS